MHGYGLWSLRIFTFIFGIMQCSNSNLFFSRLSYDILTSMFDFRWIKEPLRPWFWPQTCDRPRREIKNQYCFSKSRFAFNKCTRRGFTCLCIPGHDPPLSITVYGDISTNPGPRKTLNMLFTNHHCLWPVVCIARRPSAPVTFRRASFLLLIYIEKTNFA